MALYYEDALRQAFPFWKHLSPEEQRDLNGAVTETHYKKGSHLHGWDGECTGIILVKTGQLRAYMLSEDGREITLYRLSDGDVCILSAACVLDTITFDVFIDAVTDADILLIATNVYNRIAKENVYVECYGYKTATERFSDVMWAMQQILFMGIDKRLAIFLYDEMVKTKSAEIRMTQEEIAKNMGSAREVVSRMLKYFSGEGIVEIGRGRVLITDKEKLRKLTQ